MANVVYEMDTDDDNLRQFHVECDNPKLIAYAVNFISELPIIDKASFEAPVLSLWKYPIDGWSDLRYWESFHTHFSINACINILKNGLASERQKNKTSH